jgi:Flp pilus assembly secretin CpaC
LAEIEIFVGESRVFPTPGVGRIAVGNGAILTAAALDNREVILFANAVGTSSLFVWNEDGRSQRIKVSIVPGDTSRYAREISSFLVKMPGAKTSIIGDKVIVEGDALSDQDLAKIDELSKRYPQVVNFTNRLGWEQMILMDVKVVEFPVNELREIGVKWGATGGAAIGGIWAPGSQGNQRSACRDRTGAAPAARPSTAHTGGQDWGQGDRALRHDQRFPRWTTAQCGALGRVEERREFLHEEPQSLGFAATATH